MEDNNLYNVEEAKQYAFELGFVAVEPNRYVHKTPELKDVYLLFKEDRWEFYHCNRLTYFSSEDNLSYVLECGSAVTSFCPACGGECASQYYEETNTTALWNCDSDDLRHHYSIEGRV